MPVSTIAQLIDAQEAQATAITRKQLQNEHWQTNPNDYEWLYHRPQVEKQFGRAKRVYSRLQAMDDAKLNK